ncbi:NAD(P)-dependent glycerol-3-phosphate dehydrogenase [Candidatus Woesearchaeota archaeon]|nr:NAD(P)-dependent glycerol-3-phosphate dehydrogenase [Candidatus Woesearchaeota archaeon]
MKKISRICVIGAGSWGTSLAILLGEKGYKVSLWTRRKELADEINKKRENRQYLKNIKIPASIIATHSIKDAAENSDMVVFAVPSGFLRAIAKSFSKFIKKDAVIVHVTKGIEENSGKLMSQVLGEELRNQKIVVLSGPNHAEEVSNRLPTATVIASANSDAAHMVSRFFYMPYFKTYPHDDIIGVEICGAVKNIVAIAIGVCDGLKLGDNAKASILTLGLSEMSVIARKFGAKRETCYGLAGVGDLVATCYSHYSRNRFVGEMLAKGKSMEQIKKEMHGMVAEGVKNTKAIYMLCRSKGIETPLIAHAYKVLYEGMNLKKAISQLLEII